MNLKRFTAQKIAAYSTILFGLVLAIDGGLSPFSLVGFAIVAMGFGVRNGQIAAGQTAVAVMVLLLSLNLIALATATFLQFSTENNLDADTLGDAAGPYGIVWFFVMLSCVSLWTIANITLLIFWLRKQTTGTSNRI